VIGILCLDRHAVEPFDEEELHRAKAVAFSAAAAIRKAQLLDQVRRYAMSMEQVVNVDQAVFAGRAPEAVARVILEGALKVGNYGAGLLVLSHPDGHRVAAAIGESFAGAEGKSVPDEIAPKATTRLAPTWLVGISRALGIPTLTQGMYIVPFSTGETHMGTLALLDPNGETADDRLMEAFATRAATAFLHAVKRG
jgi:hypothetical protein